MKQSTINPGFVPKINGSETLYLIDNQEKVTTVEREYTKSDIGLDLPSSFPASSKKYISGSRKDVRVPYREVALSPTQHSHGVEINPPIPIYDCSGPFSDPDYVIDLAVGLPKLRRNWIEERSDTEQLPSPSSEYHQRADDSLTHEIRFPMQPKPYHALQGRTARQWTGDALQPRRARTRGQRLLSPRLPALPRSRRGCSDEEI